MWERRKPLLQYQVTVAGFTKASGQAQTFPYTPPNVTLRQTMDGFMVSLPSKQLAIEVSEIINSTFVILCDDRDGLKFKSSPGPEQAYCG